MGKKNKRSVAAPSKYVPTNKRSYGWVWGVAVVIVVAIIVAVSIFMGVKKNTEENDGSGITVKHASVSVTKTYIEFRGDKATNSTKVADIYEDPRCPGCALFEREQGADIAKAIDEGRVIVHYHLMDFLNQVGSTNYSTRANAALIAVARTGDAKAAYTLHSMIWHQAPAESAEAHEFTNEELAEWAKKLGVKDETVQEIARGEAPQLAATAMGATNLKKLNEAMNGQGGTPAVFVNGELVPNASKDTDWLQ